MQRYGGILVAIIASASAAALGQNDPARVETGEVSRNVSRTHAYQYAIAFPPDYQADGEQRWPMVVDLHGSGRPALQTLKRQAAARDDRFIWLLPRHDGQGWWDPDTLAKLIEHVRSNHRVDRDRVSVLGFSMGGFGAWDFAAEHPHLVAAIAPIAGAGNPFKARRLVHVPVWAFHGKQDGGVGVELAEAMVHAAQRAGGEAKLTVYPDVGHGCRELAMSNGRLYEWLLAQRRGTRAPDEWLARAAHATRLQSTPTLDGKLDDKAWRPASTLTGFMRPLAVQQAEVQTDVRLGYNDDRLYVAFNAWDPHISNLRADRTQRDAEIWFDDSVEVLIDTNRDKKTYFQFVANANGALYDAKGFDGQWHAEGVEIAAAKQDDRWTVELAIPWKALGRAAPQPGQAMGMLFAQTHQNPGQPRYYTQWPPTNGKGNHAPERFAPITFGEADESR